MVFSKVSQPDGSYENVAALLHFGLVVHLFAERSRLYRYGKLPLLSRHRNSEQTVILGMNQLRIAQRVGLGDFNSLRS